MKSSLFYSSSIKNVEDNNSLEDEQSSNTFMPKPPEIVSNKSTKRSRSNNSKTSPNKKIKQTIIADPVGDVDQSTFSKIIEFIVTRRSMLTDSKKFPDIKYQHFLFKSKADFLSLISTVRISEDPHICVDYNENIIGSVGYAHNRQILFFHKYSLHNTNVFVYPNFLDFQTQLLDKGVSRLYLKIHPSVVKSLTTTDKATPTYAVFSFPIGYLAKNNDLLSEAIIHEVPSYVTLIPKSSFMELISFSNSSSSSSSITSLSVKSCQLTIPPSESSMIPELNNGSDTGVFPLSTPLIKQFVLCQIKKKTFLDIMTTIRSKDEIFKPKEPVKFEDIMNLQKMTIRISIKEKKFTFENVKAEAIVGSLDQPFNDFNCQDVELSDNNTNDTINLLVQKILTPTINLNLNNLQPNVLCCNMDQNDEFGITILFDHLKEILSTITEENICFIITSDFPLFIKTVHSPMLTNESLCISSIFIVPVKNT